MTSSARQATFDVERPDRPLNRVTTALRAFTVIPAAILLASVSGGGFWTGSGNTGIRLAFGGPGLLFVPPLLMLVFREKYPRWWFDFNRELMRFSARVGVYAALLTDVYPSTDEPQGVRVGCVQVAGAGAVAQAALDAGGGGAHVDHAPISAWSGSRPARSAR